MNRQEASEKIAALRAKLNYYNEKYYQEHISEISDYEFDKLLSELSKLEEAFPEFFSEDSPTQRVGGDITKSFKQVKHRYPMLSLSNNYDAGEIKDWIGRVQKGVASESLSYICELKYDGVAISLVYEYGKLTQAITRGDGVQGDEVTANVKTIKAIPLLLKSEEAKTIPRFEVRGEIFMPREVFLKLNEQRAAEGEALLANPRNTASGTLKMQDSKVVAQRKLNCYCYAVYGEDLPFESQEQALEFLSKAGFNISPTWRRVNSIEDILHYINEWAEKRSTLPLDTDGCVIKVNEYAHQESLGFTAKSPKWAVAYKYAAENVSTKLESVSYQVGRTGAVTPVANLQPVLIAGTVVKRATLHNADEIKRLDLHEYDTVFVEKGGEIIPKVTGIDFSLRFPSSLPITMIGNCPACGTELYRIAGEAAYYCPNELGCEPQILGKIKHFIARKAADIDNLGPETLAALYARGYIHSVADLYSLNKEQLLSLPNFKEKSAQNVLNGIESSKQVPFARILFGLGIRFVGATVAEKLARHFKSIDALLVATNEQLLEAPEVGQIIAQSVIKWAAEPKNLELISKLKEAGLQLNHLEEEKVVLSNSLEGSTFVISGVFTHFERDELKAHIEMHGGKVVSSISGKLNYLLAGENMGPAKKEKAEGLRVKIISETEYLEMVGGK